MCIFVLQEGQYEMTRVVFNEFHCFVFILGKLRETAKSETKVI